MSAFVSRMFSILVHILPLQICDDSNQARGFAIIGTSIGLGRLTVSNSLTSVEILLDTLPV